MVTRTEGNDWIVLQAEDHGYDVKEGDVFNWTDSFCSRMVEGLGPCIAPNSGLVPAYLEAPIGRQVDIEAYVGLPLTKPDGTLFGTLCAIDPKKQSDDLIYELPQLELISRMLGTILSSELRAESEMRRAERAEMEASTDSLTGLYNRRGWDMLLSGEEERCRDYGNQASVLAIDLDGLKIINDKFGHSSGDEVIVKAAHAIKAATRECDVLARVGGDEFAVLAVQCDTEQGRKLVSRLEASLAEAGLQASIGLAHREPSKSLADAWTLADDLMYQCKRGRKTSRDYQPATSA